MRLTVGNSQIYTVRDAENGIDIHNKSREIGAVQVTSIIPCPNDECDFFTAAQCLLFRDLKCEKHP